MSVHRKDLAQIYSLRMEHHGLGMGLFRPVSTNDLSPPCCGFFDRNGDWNLITKLEHSPDRKLSSNRFEPLSEPLIDVTEITIKWQPKTSNGVQEQSIDTSANTPNNVAGGADVHIKYTSNCKFGAVLMTQKPVVLKAYHQERLFSRWLEANKRALYDQYGRELRKYGLWIITKTYSTVAASINSWSNQDKDVLVSIAAKASMLGELGSNLSTKDTVMDKDWSHYCGKTAEDRVVVFADGIQTTSNYWLWKSLEYNLPLITTSRSPSRAPGDISFSLRGPVIRRRSSLKNDDLLNTPGTRHLSYSYDRPHTLVNEPEPELYDPSKHDQTRHLSLSAERPSPQENEHDLLHDAFGGMHNISRAQSVRQSSRPVSMISVTHSEGGSRTPSLRREARDISQLRR